MDATTRYSQSRRITLFGAAKNAFLAFIKILFGITGHSHALLADGVHSLSDLLIDALVLIASRIGNKAPDREHNYGHGRIETAATVVLAFILGMAGVGIMIDAGYEIFGVRTVVKPAFYVLLVAVISMVINEILYRYTRAVGERVNSNLIITNAWHHRSDSASSLVVLIGAGAAWFGFGVLDAVAAVIVGAMIIRMAWSFALSSARELVDTAIDGTIIEQIKKNIQTVPGVRAIHQLRTRSMGGAIFLDLHIMVEPMISVSEGHYIAQQVHFQLMQQNPDITDVTVHIDPEDDEVVAPSKDLPSRVEIINLLKQRWQGLVEPKLIEDITLHYLGGKVYVELRVPAEQGSFTELSSKLKQAVADQNFIASVKVFAAL